MFSRIGHGFLVLALLWNGLEVVLVTGRNMKFIAVTDKCGNTFASNCSGWIENGTFNYDMTTIQTIDYGLRVFLQIQIKLQGSTSFQTLLSYDIEYCKLVNEVFGGSLLRAWFKNMLKYSNFMENCPVTKGHYYVRKLIMEPSSIPVYLQPGNYRIVANAYYGKRKTKKERLALYLGLDMLLF